MRKGNKIVADCALKENGQVATNDDGSVKEIINKGRILTKK